MSKKLAKEIIDLITIIGGCDSIREVRKILDKKGLKVEEHAYKILHDK